MSGSTGRCFWLDGSAGREWSGRRSLTGQLGEDDVSLSYDATTGVVTRHRGGQAVPVDDDVFVALDRELAQGPPDAIWVGWFGYAARPDLPARAGGTGVDAVWMRASRVRETQPAPQPTSTVAPSPRDAAQRSPVVPPEYAAAFARIQDHLRAGNSYEVNLTYRAGLRSELDPLAAYRALRRLNPAPYAGFIQHAVPGATAWLLSSSPERFATVEVTDGGRTIETRPIKGTLPRGASTVEDEELRRLLASEPKFRAENLMVVDLLRNDLSMVCEPGTVRVPTLMEVESYPSVHQLVSTVRGRIRPEVTTVEALRALFPAGSMTGAPKLRTMQIIEEVETTPRGIYAGAYGWVAADGSADLAVVIRSLTTTGDGEWLLGTGGGITVLSDLEEEYRESTWKAERLRAALMTTGTD